MKPIFIQRASSNLSFLKAIIVAFFIFLYSSSNAQVNVIMNHNDLKRTGWNNRESILTVDNVSSGNFGKIFSRDVDDQIYTQPLILSNFSIAGGIHNIVIVATVNNSVYAFDADNASAATPYWHVNLTYDSANYRPVKNTDMTGACSGNYADFSGNIGIVGTPAIDTATNTLYVVARSVSKDGSKFVQYLHAIDIKTGNEKGGSPVYITAGVSGTGDGIVNGLVAFQEQRENQRPGLLLYNGIVYICWASHCDWGPYHGWIIGYDASTLEQKYVYNTSANGGDAGIWMSGQPPSVDDNGNIYLTTGNGSTGQNGNPNDPVNRGTSLLKLSTDLKLNDFFTPMNFKYLNDLDLDYGIDGALLIPGTHLSLSGSKEGKLYLIDNNNMGHTTSNNSNVLQTLNVGNTPTSLTKHLHGSPVYFKDDLGNENIYAWAENSFLAQFPFDRSTMTFDTINVKLGNTVLPAGMPGAILSISSNGSQSGTGILWASHPINGNANQAVVPGILQAFDAKDVSHELWNSNWNSKRDSIGLFAKFVPPTIANGKVYMATFSNKLNVYGLNPPPASPCASTLTPEWQSADIGYVAYPGDACINNGVFTITASGDDIWNTKDAFHYVFQKVVSSGTTITARVVSIRNTNSFAKCGVMFRQNLDPGSPYVFLSLIPSNYVYMQERNTQNISATNVGNQANDSAPFWVRIVNNGNQYTSYVSKNGNDWNVMDSVTLAMGNNSYVGIAYTTHDNLVLDTAVVDNVQITTTGSPATNVLNLTAKNINEKYALMNWITNSEFNNDHFDIERSASNTDFQKIGSVQGHGTTSVTNNYSFTDNSPMNGANFYRLRQVDINGNSSYSSVVKVLFNLKKIQIFPNPASNKIYIYNNSFSNGGNLIVEIIGFSGKILYKQISKPNDKNIITLNIPPKIPNGIYVVLVINQKGEKQGDQIFIMR